MAVRAGIRTRNRLLPVKAVKVGQPVLIVVLPSARKSRSPSSSTPPVPNEASAQPSFVPPLAAVMRETYSREGSDGLKLTTPPIILLRLVPVGLPSPNSAKPKPNWKPMTPVVATGVPGSFRDGSLLMPAPGTVHSEYWLRRKGTFTARRRLSVWALKRLVKKSGWVLRCSLAFAIGAMPNTLPHEDVRTVWS